MKQEKIEEVLELDDLLSNLSQGFTFLSPLFDKLQLQLQLIEIIIFLIRRDVQKGDGA